MMDETGIKVFVGFIHNLYVELFFLILYFEANYTSTLIFVGQ